DDVEQSHPQRWRQERIASVASTTATTATACAVVGHVFISCEKLPDRGQWRRTALCELIEQREDAILRAGLAGAGRYLDGDEFVQQFLRAALGWHRGGFHWSDGCWRFGLADAETFFCGCRARFCRFSNDR